MDIINITIEQSSKNIIVEYVESLYDQDGNEVKKDTVRKGFNPSLKADWTAISSNEKLESIKNIVWVDLTEPEEPEE